MTLRLNRRVPLSPVDTAWLRMEDSTNLMMITGVFLFEQPVDFELLRATIESRLLRFDRFKQRVVRPRLSLRPPYWEDDPNFDISAHLHRIALPAPGDQVALQELVNDFMSTPLDFSKPLWQLHLVENYGDGCALLCRLHHCIADGIALMRVLLSLTDDEANPPALSRSFAASNRQTESESPRPGRPILPLNRYRRLARGFLSQGIDILADPARTRDVLKFGADSTAALANLLLLSPDPHTPFKGKLGVSKRCAWSKPILLADVKAVGRVTGGTVNDVLLTAVSGALGRYLHSRGEPTGGLDFRAVVPVNLRPPDEELKLGNAFGLVFLSLPVGVHDPLDRLNELKRRMDGLKGTPEAVVAYGILNAIGIATSEIEDLVVKLFGMKATAVMTNVPGPREVRYFAGQPIDGLMFWVPQSGRLGLGVSILSYAGEVLVGFATDAGLTPDPESIVNLFHEEFGELMELVRLAQEADAEMAALPIANGRCQAQTNKNRQCKNPAMSGSPFCHVHQ